MQPEAWKQKLIERKKELEKWEAQNEIERQKLELQNKVVHI